MRSNDPTFSLVSFSLWRNTRAMSRFWQCIKQQRPISELFIYDIRNSETWSSPPLRIQIYVNAINEWTKLESPFCKNITHREYSKIWMKANINFFSKWFFFNLLINYSINLPHKNYVNITNIIFVLMYIYNSYNAVLYNLLCSKNHVIILFYIIFEIYKNSHA